MADQGPLAAWNFENVGPRGMTDATGHGFLATVTGDIKLVPGHSGQAGSFNGQSWLTVAEPAMFNLSDATLALWIKPETIKGRHGLIAKRFIGTAAPYVVSLWDGAIEFEANDTNDKWSFNFRTPVVIKEGEWNHLAVVIKQGKGVTIYINGQPVATKENTMGRTMNMEPLIIGREAWSDDSTVNSCWYQGLMDDVKVWGRALTPAEVLKEAGK
jgi:hypothetical protein